MSTKLDSNKTLKNVQARELYIWLKETVRVETGEGAWIEKDRKANEGMAVLGVVPHRTGMYMKINKTIQPKKMLLLLHCPLHKLVRAVYLEDEVKNASNQTRRKAAAEIECT